MPSPTQIAGALLEEAILYLLEAAGYQALRRLDGDPTVDPDAPAVTLRGRGTRHQIDAVADPVFAYPFANPTRLLVEAKAYAVGHKVALPVLRNALGTLRDLEEFWVPGAEGTDVGPRYHYRYAVFSTSDFTGPAQDFAYAHDIYLLPLRGSAFFAPVVDALDQLKRELADVNDLDRLSNYRRELRAALGAEAMLIGRLAGLVQAVSRIRHGLVATAMTRFPIFLVPRDPVVVQELRPRESVRIFKAGSGWVLRRASSGVDLFSFDLPQELFRLYATSDPTVGRTDALQMKAQGLRYIDAYVLRGSGGPRLVRFELDMDWVTRLLESDAPLPAT